MKLTCPICQTRFDDSKYKVAEFLEDKGYFHLDLWVKCPKCKYTPAFGKELTDAKPIYWRPKQLPHTFKQQVIQAFHKYTPEMHCPWCSSFLELHKIWVHSWKHDPEAKAGNPPVKSEASEPVRAAFQFMVQNSEGKVGKYFIPAGILGQYKCVNHKCKYVRYVTL